jgi:hypothetical protein
LTPRRLFRLSRDLTQAQATTPIPSMASEVSASATVECITSGATTPATSALARLPTQACTEEAMPRRSGHLVQRQQRDGRHHQRPAEGKHRHRQQGPGSMRLQQQVAA